MEERKVMFASELTLDRTCEDAEVLVVAGSGSGLDSVLNTGGAVKSAAPEEPIHEPQESGRTG